MMTILNTYRKNGVNFYYYVKNIFQKEYNTPCWRTNLEEKLEQNLILVKLSYL